ncbi:MAG: COX15/CtaA family protein [Solirubrobacterales bacterium]
MHSVAARGGAELARFRRLIDLIIVATFVLIVVGGVVRVSDSGLGCGPAGSGAEGWPLCGGRVLPFLEQNAVIEFTHRIVAGVVAILILLLAWRALRGLREQRWLVRGSVAAAILVLAQAALGGLTVENNLHEVLVAAHLGLAMLLLAILIALRRATLEGSAAPAPGGTLRPLAATALVLLFATIVAGGYMAGTQREGAEGGPVAGAHLACGKEFPTCAGEAMPFGSGELVDVHLTHRAFMYLAAVAILAMVIVARRRGVRSPAFPLALVLLACQILLGALNVWLGEHGELIVAHLTLATLLWGTVVYAASALVPVPVPGRAPLRRAETEASASPA